MHYQVDVRKREQVESAVDSFAEAVGGIDAVLNAAGVSLWKDFLDMDDAFWDLVYDVNVKGTFLVNQAVVRHMIKQQDGIILNIASMSAVKSGMPGASAYASSKWAIVGFSRNLHLELQPQGIRVACYCPGSTRTALHEQAKTENME
ncbi:MAG: SDR family oxidoreductase, partial [Planctomycetes bacterium]|nr:SDR family oxidoreductase [Planctomycetota bacterium]